MSYRLARRCCKRSIISRDLEGIAGSPSAKLVEENLGDPRICLCAQVVDFLCGDQYMKGEQMEAANKLLFQHGWYKVFATGTMQKIRMNSRTFTQLRHMYTIRNRLRHGEPIGILKCLSMTRDSLASDSRDYLYGKLGLIGDRAAALRKPNYRDTTLDVCRAFTENYIRNEGDLYIICLAGMAPRSSSSPLPSWLPDWGFARPSYPLCCGWSDRLSAWPMFDAAQGAKPEVELLENSLVLKCQGIIFDDIDGVQFDPWSQSSTGTKDGFPITIQELCILHQQTSFRCAISNCCSKHESVG